MLKHAVVKLISGSGKLEAVLRFLSKQGQLQPHFHSKSGKLST